jgi:hypothetical protein
METQLQKDLNQTAVAAPVVRSFIPALAVNRVMPLAINKTL